MQQPQQPMMQQPVMGGQPVMQQPQQPMMQQPVMGAQPAMQQPNNQFPNNNGQM
jgi:flagellar motor switch protein FliN/FliY